jgi:phospholipid/cholesterol/gamma-HCH transport system substrate-binding protein
MSRNIVETVLGAVVLIVAIGFLSWAYGRSNVGGPAGYELVAKFDRADGLDVGADVRLSGIRIGSVIGQSLDAVTYRAVVNFTVDNGIELPSDSSAAIVSSGLLGGKYLSLTPGADEEMLVSGEEVVFTQSSVNLEDLIGRFIFNSSGSDE